MNLLLKKYLQIFCIIIVSIGIGIEIHYGANIGFVLITSGSLVFAISCKIQHRIKKEVNKNAAGKEN